MFVAAMGKSTLGLSLGLNVAETLLAPAMPSTSARAGGAPWRAGGASAQAHTPPWPGGCGRAVAALAHTPAFSQPSPSCRAGPRRLPAGIFMPIIKSLSETAGSMPNDPSRLKMGA